MVLTRQKLRRAAREPAVRICIFGAGAIGGYLGAHFARVPGIQVSVVGRGPQLVAIRQHGLRIVGPDATFNINVCATDRPEELGPQDYVFITLKSHQVGPALPGIASLIGAETTVIPPTTGIPFWYFHGQKGPFADHRLQALDPGNRQGDVLGPERALGCVFWVATEVEAPGVIRHDGAGASFPIGEPDDTVSPRLERLAGAMREAMMKAPVTTNIRGWLWIKMISSLCWNPVATLGHATLGQVHEHPAAVEIVRRMMIEAENVATALGVELPVGREKRIATTRLAGGHKMSMLQDLERGRPLEIDALADSITTMREIAGVATPTIDLVLTLLRLRADSLVRAENA
jgi:2-dehydropantoate 2-reductase